MSGRGKGWVITINNWTEEQLENLKKLDTDYIIIGDEIAPTTGTPHLQAYLHFKNARDFKSMVKKIPGGHIIKANGSDEQNQVYCSKDKVIYEAGKIPEQGKRTDLDMAREIVKEGGGMKRVVEECRSYQSVKMAEQWLKYNEPERNWKPEIYWFWGKSGSGKTREARAMCEDPWISGRNLKWWNGYDGHKEVIIDDFRRDFCTFHELLRILDRYPYRVENKGGSRQLLARKIIITSPLSPHEVYETREDLAQLIRRIDVVRHFDTEVNDTEVGGNSMPRQTVTMRVLELIKEEKEKIIP